MKYTILEAKALSALALAVNERLQCGWELAGGVNVTTEHCGAGRGCNGISYYQALTFKEGK